MIHNFLLVNICILPTKEPVLANSTSKTHPSSGKCSRRDTGRVEGAVLGGTRQGLTRNSKPSVGKTLGAHRRTSNEPHYGRRGRTQVDWPADVTDAESLKCGSWRQRKSPSRSRSGSVQKILTVKRYASAFVSGKPRRRKKRGEQGRKTKFFPSPLG